MYFTRALQSNPFQNPGGWSEHDKRRRRRSRKRTKILVSNIGKIHTRVLGKKSIVHSMCIELQCKHLQTFVHRLQHHLLQVYYLKCSVLHSVTRTVKSTLLCLGTYHNCSALLCHLSIILCTALSLVTIDLPYALSLVTIALSSLSLPSEWHFLQISQHPTTLDRLRKADSPTKVGENKAIFKRPGKAGDVLQTPLSFIHSFIHSLSHDL